MALTPKQITQDLIEYLSSSPSPYHVAREAEQRLTQAGFSRLLRSERLKVRPGGAYYIRDGAALVAWKSGSQPRRGLRWVVAHSDSPGLRLRPSVTAPEVDSYQRFGVDVYGTPLLHTWLDRELGLAGRVIVDDGGHLRSRLVYVATPVCVIPSLAVHFNPAVNKQGLVINPHTDLRPVAMSGAAPSLARLLSRHLDVPFQRVRAHDLCLVDVSKPRVLGLNGDLLCAQALDNRAMCHAAVTALCNTPTAPTRTCGVTLFDHEEVGSRSAVGAAGPLLDEVLNRLAPGGQGSALRQRSLLFSTDMGHGVHPNYPSFHDELQRPTLNGGPMLKTSCNQRYATDDRALAFVRQEAATLDIPLQEFTNRADISCGTTLGPTCATRLGMRVVDLGNPLLGMHSIRETCGLADHPRMCSLLSHLLH